MLLLQGPVGPFFDRLTAWLQERGTRVHRIALQGGDLADTRRIAPITYTAPPEEWAPFIAKQLQALQPCCVVLFGQTRFYHVHAIEAANQAGIPIVVLEEGYVRPGYITMELGGVNGYSTTLKRYRWEPANAAPTLQHPPTTKHQFRQMALFAMRHYLHMRWASTEFPHYSHHKPTSIARHAAYWVRSWLRKQIHQFHDNRQVRLLANNHYFLVALQHDGDSQITHHSRFTENTDFIIEVMCSFAQHAPAQATLVFKQHPFSRGGPGHIAFIRSLARELGISNRVQALVEGHTPTLVRHAQGVLVINSTVGMQSLVHRKPLMVMGEALYKQPGVTFGGELNDFWAHHHPPAEPETSSLLAQIIHLTQVPCNVYGLPTEPLLWHMPPREGQSA